MSPVRHQMVLLILITFQSKFSVPSIQTARFGSPSSSRVGLAHLLACFRVAERLPLSSTTRSEEVLKLWLLPRAQREQCETDTVKLLKHLAAEGHKASLSKVQFVQSKLPFWDMTSLQRGGLEQSKISQSLA